MCKTKPSRRWWICWVTALFCTKTTIFKNKTSFCNDNLLIRRKFSPNGSCCSRWIIEDRTAGMTTGERCDGHDIEVELDDCSGQLDICHVHQTRRTQRRVCSGQPQGRRQPSSCLTDSSQSQPLLIPNKLSATTGPVKTTVRSDDSNRIRVLQRRRSSATLQFPPPSTVTYWGISLIRRLA